MAGERSTVHFGSTKGDKGDTGAAAINSTITLADFEQPTPFEGLEGLVWNPVLVLVASTAGRAVGQAIYIQGGGHYKILSLESATALTMEPLSDPNYSYEYSIGLDATYGATIAAGAAVVTSGLLGPQGEQGEQGETSGDHARLGGTYNGGNELDTGSDLLFTPGSADGTHLEWSSGAFNVLRPGGVVMQVTLSGKLDSDTGGETVILSLVDSLNAVIDSFTASVTFNDAFAQRYFIRSKIVSFPQANGYKIRANATGLLNSNLELDLVMVSVVH